MHVYPPAFWFKDSPWGVLLEPVAKLYSWAVTHHLATAKVQHLPCPVVCVGNVILGGTGKTPTCLALAHYLQEWGHTPHILSRGWGRKTTTIRRVNSEKDTHLTVGDEPLLLARQFPTWVGRNRYDAGQKAINQGATVLILDDGHQHPFLHKDISFLLVDGLQGWGNGRVLPAGPLREPLAGALQRADALISFNGGTPPLPFEKPVIPAQMIPSPVSIKGPVTAFCGLGFPEKFRKTLNDLALPIAHFQAFPDHWVYQERDLTSLKGRGCPLVTTEKDFVKLSPTWQRQVTPIPISVVIQDKERLHQCMSAIAQQFPDSKRSEQFR